MRQRSGIAEEARVRWVYCDAVLHRPERRHRSGGRLRILVDALATTWMKASVRVRHRLN